MHSLAMADMAINIQNSDQFLFLSICPNNNCHLIEKGMKMNGSETFQLIVNTNVNKWTNRKTELYAS